MFPFECDFCILNFSSRFERNQHTKLHFKQKYCISCNKTLIQIGDEWYELRLHVDEKCSPTTFHAGNDEDVKNMQQNINPFQILEPSVPYFKEEENDYLETSLLDNKLETEYRSAVDDEAIMNDEDETNRHTIAVSDTKPSKPEIETLVDNECDAKNDVNMKAATKLEKQYSTESESKAIQYECSDCQTTFTARSSLVRHLKKGHSKTERTTNKNLNTRRNCNQCDKSFATTERLKSHIQIVHEGKELFKCEICEKTYSSRGSLKTHLIIHSEVRPFICNYCGRGFNSRYGLDEHMHTHTDDRPFVCKICDKTFKQNRLLVAHTRVHTRERPYKCKEEGCDRAYINGIDLKRHRFSKHGIFTKKHTCHICSKIFPEKKLLRKHMEHH